MIATAEGVRFGLVELDLLATHAGVACPFPLQVPSFGRIAGEREVLLRTAGQTLELRGLADGSGPTGAAADLADALGEHRAAIDLLLTGPDGTTAVAVLLHRSWAALCLRPLGDALSGQVEVRWIGQDDLVRAVLGMLPRLGGARTMPITLPARAVHGAAGVLDEVDRDAERQRRLRELVRDCGGDPAQLDQLVRVLPVVTGRGQLGATRRGRGGVVRDGTELSWVDGPAGRLRIGTAGGWVSVNPLRPPDLEVAVTELVGAARSAR
ncbi:MULTISPECIES: ESX secretion-associated protein EspG [unclassified Saccharopolyspora]|uniref:ESX secretion-associated protein EspG n=1 Tax=unclassified Saccharopolyspora TaxID=2646250 RepID=UPI001CD2EE86|nr:MULTISPECIES: ESX secretion-associated protein EspG [unclassified Saccharopolyspora]MCA1190335.1 ESX secretion-associated protein EspG [Saccharopolyspora sp. 6T]MCA1194928.1 ESX secretion-associated protein EspG [Saccharopolyspora sp. 6V]MCA1226369.1 ESX secretion-associated protein EspG [Saccharopolyspora sp. 6M]MCA1279120.1 ESX secretion-associated protein EspG [Saccharopolyspora sp. 7B]